MRNEETYPGSSLASVGLSSASGDLGSNWPVGPGAVKGQPRVLVRELVDVATYRGRRASFDGITGTIRGLVDTEAVGLRPGGGTVSVAGPTKLVLVDELGYAHELEFGAHDYVTLLD